MSAKEEENAEPALDSFAFMASFAVEFLYFSVFFAPPW
jgi:hypothetical protein